MRTYTSAYIGIKLNIHFTGRTGVGTEGLIIHAVKKGGKGKN